MQTELRSVLHALPGLELLEPLQDLRRAVIGPVAAGDGQVRGT
jgi:hypothetical protein